MRELTPGPIPSLYWWITEVLSVGVKMEASLAGGEERI